MPVFSLHHFLSHEALALCYLYDFYHCQGLWCVGAFRGMLLGIVFWPALVDCFCRLPWVPREELAVWHQKAFPSPCTPLIFSSEWGILHPFQGRKLQWPLSLESIKLPLNSCFLPRGLPSFSSLLLTEHFRVCPYLEISNFSHVILQSGQYFCFPLSFLMFPWFSPPPSGTPHTTPPLILRWFYLICSRVLCMELGCVCCV